MIKFSRVWSMPNGETFSIKPIKELIAKYLEEKKGGIFIDPFVRNSPFKSLCISNDLDPEIIADYHMDALDFLKEMETNSADIVLYDPPYSQRQVAECYKKLDKTVNMQTTQTTFWTYLKAEIGRISKPDTIVISLGWNTGGIGKKLGYEIIEILLVPHGSRHNDTIVTVEIKK